MKKSRFMDSQIMEAVKRAESGLAVPEICRDLGIRSATFYKRRAKYGGIDLPDFFEPIISGEMALREKGRADEKEPLCP